jgi:hypothetical protein
MDLVATQKVRSASSAERWGRGLPTNASQKVAQGAFNPRLLDGIIDDQVCVDIIFAIKHYPNIISKRYDEELPINVCSTRWRVLDPFGAFYNFLGCLSVSIDIGYLLHHSLEAAYLFYFFVSNSVHFLPFITAIYSSNSNEQKVTPHIFIWKLFTSVRGGVAPATLRGQVQVVYDTTK